MCRSEHRRSYSGFWAASLLLATSLLATGCQVEMGGQTLPSPWYLTDDVQYYPPGPEFKLAREAAAMKENAAAYKSSGLSRGGVE